MDIENLKEKFEEKHGSFNFKIIDHYDFWLLSRKTLKDIEDVCRENFPTYADLCRYPESMERYFGKEDCVYCVLKGALKRKLSCDIMFKTSPYNLTRLEKECLEKVIERLRIFRLARYGKAEESKLFTLDIDDYDIKYQLIRKRCPPFKLTVV